MTKSTQEPNRRLDDKAVQETPTLSNLRQNPELALSPASIIENLQSDGTSVSTGDSLSPQQVVQTPSDVAEITGNFLDMITSDEWNNPYIQDVAMDTSTESKKNEWKQAVPKNKKNKKNAKVNKAEERIVEPANKVLGDTKSKIKVTNSGQRCKFCDLVHPQMLGDVRAGVSTCPFVRFLHSIWREQFNFYSRDGKAEIRFTGRSKKVDSDKVPMFPHKEPLVSWIRLEFEMSREEDPNIHEQPMRSLAEQLRVLGSSCNVPDDGWSDRKIKEAKELYDECAKATKAQMDRWASTLAVRGHGAVRQQPCWHNPRCFICGRPKDPHEEQRHPARRGPVPYRGQNGRTPHAALPITAQWRPRVPGFQQRLHAPAYPYPYGRNFRG